MLKILNKIHKSHFCTRSSKWDILTAVCLERKPIVVPEMNDLEKRFNQYLEEIDIERSFKSNHELRIDYEHVHKELLESSNNDLDTAIQITSQDFEDACDDEFNSFTGASRLTKDENDQKSLNRKLDKYLFYVVEQQLGSKKYFLLPQSKVMNGETLRDAAERVMNEFCGNHLKWKLYGNAPVGFYKYRYPRGVRQKNATVGAKTFFYLARFLTGNVNVDVGGDANYLWIDSSEMMQVLPSKYYKSISEFIITDYRNLDQNL